MRLQGAEAIVTKKGDAAIKDRVAKRYRHPELDDRLRKQRTKYEERLLKKAAKVISVPKVLNSDGTTLTLEFIDGPQVKELLDEQPELAREIGKKLAKIHALNIIHGDLTTSNMISTALERNPASDVRVQRCAVSRAEKTRSEAKTHAPQCEIVFIDFGLAFTSTRIEDKAVDIHLFRQALESKHHRVFDKAYRQFLKGYREAGDEAVIDRLKQVEARGRNKAKF